MFAPLSLQKMKAREHSRGFHLFFDVILRCHLNSTFCTKKQIPSLIKPTPVALGVRMRAALEECPPEEPGLFLLQEFSPRQKFFCTNFMFHAWWLFSEYSKGKKRMKKEVF